MSESICLVLPYANEGGVRYPDSSFAAIRLTPSCARLLLEVSAEERVHSTDHEHPLLEVVRHFTIAEPREGNFHGASSAVSRHFGDPANRRVPTLAPYSAARHHNDRTDTVHHQVLGWDAEQGSPKIMAKLRSRFPGVGEMDHATTAPLTREVALMAALHAGPGAKRDEWFRELAEIAPHRAAEMLTEGTPVVGDRAARVQIAGDLDRETLLVFLASDVKTHRQAAFTALAEAGHEPPEPTSTDTRSLS